MRRLLLPQALQLPLFVFHGTETFVVKHMSVSHSVAVLAGKDSTSAFPLRYETDGVSVNGVGVNRFGENDNDPVEILPVEVLL